MAKAYLHELQAQLNLIKEKLSQIHIPKGPLAPPPDPQLIERRNKLLERKRVIEDRIMFYDPPETKP